MKTWLWAKSKGLLCAILLAALVLPLCSPAASAAGAAADAEEDLTQYIDMYVGVHSDSNTIIGPQRPNASVNPAPDMTNAGLTGYSKNGEIQGFSQLHVSGTGVGKYGQFLISPQTGLDTGLSYGHNSPWDNEVATCSEYQVHLTKYDIDCAFTPAEHSTIYRFTYPEQDVSSLVVDMAHNLANGVKATDVNVTVTVEDGKTVFTASGYYDGGKGWSFSDGGWGAGHYVYFYAEVNREAEVTGVFDDTGVQEGVNALTDTAVKDFVTGLGAYMTFATEEDDTVMMKVGVSFKSVEQAKEWLDAEIPEWDYDAVKTETERQWNEELHKIVIDSSVSDAEKKMFYSAVYHAHVMPRDRSGDYAQYSDEAAMIDDHFATWDTWRTLYPLYSITNPDLVEKTVESFIERKRIDRDIRDSFVGGHNMIAQQGGDNTDNMLAEAILKGIVTGETAEQAYAVLKDDAENYRLNWQGWNSVQPDNNGETGQSYYRAIGYIPGNIGNGYTDTDPANVHVSTCSYTLEYAYNDYCTAMAAKLLGKDADYETYLERSKNWLNLWNPDVVKNGYSGFIWPKTLDGEFMSSSTMDPGAHQSSWSPYFYEASSYDYSFFAPHDVETLIELMGGEETFCARLQEGVSKGYIEIGNEPAFLTPYLFAYTSKPYLTTDVVTKLLTRFSTAGMPGNDDSGAMSSWYIFSNIGIFPNAGTDEYFFTSPRYPKTTISLDNGKTLTLTANHLSSENKYIQSITINGEPYYSTKFTHDVITSGGEIVFEMGSTPVNYAQPTTATAEVSDAVGEVNLDNGGYTEWAHFTSASEINRSASTSSPAIAPAGLTVSGRTETVAAGDGAPVFSWTAGKPTATASGLGDVVLTGGTVEWTVELDGGESRLDLYTAGDGRAVLTVCDASGNVLETAELWSGAQVLQYKKVSIQLASSTPETYTIRLTAEGGRAGVAAAGLADLSLYTVAFDSMGGSVVQNRAVTKGSKLEKPADPTRSGYTFQGWYQDDGLTLPWDFETDTVQASMTLYAKWTVQEGIFVESIAVPAGSTVVDLSNYEDWSHFGYGHTNLPDPDNKTGSITTTRKEGGTAFGAISSGVSKSDRNEWNDNQPFAFTWNNGTPVAEASENRDFSWATDELILPVTVPAGSYQITLYLTGIRCRSTMEILDEAGQAVVSEQELWGNTGDTRTYRIATINFNTTEERTYSIHLKVDPTNHGDWCSVAIAAATLQKGLYHVEAVAGAHGSVSVRGGTEQGAGQTVTVTAKPDAGYQFAGWQVADEALTLNRPLANPLTFTMPAQDVTLTAAFIQKVTAVESVTDISGVQEIDLSDPQYIDWVYMGNNAPREEGSGDHYPTTPDQKAEPKLNIIADEIQPVDTSWDVSYYRGEDLNRAPYFKWSDGTLEPVRDNVSGVVWSANANGGLYFDLTFEAGQYETDLFLRGVRCGGILQVLRDDGTTLLDSKLWDCPGDSQTLQKVTLSFDCEEAVTYTIRLLVDNTDFLNDWYSVGIYAVAVRHLHEGISEWTTDEEKHWHECAFGETFDLAAHTFEWVVDKEATATTDGLRHQECTVCHYALEGEIIPATGPDTPPVTPTVPSKPSVSASKPALPFTDVSENASYYDAVKYVYEEGLMNGTSDTKFSPSATLNRAMVVTILHRMEGKPAVSYTGKFPDVADGVWYTDGVEWAAKNGIVTGYTNGNYGPLDPVTREQLAAILYRYAQYKGYDVTAADALDAYTDGASVSEYAKTPAAWAAGHDLLESAAGKLRPSEEATRAEVAVAIAGFHKAFVK